MDGFEGWTYEWEKVFNLHSYLIQTRVINARVDLAFLDTKKKPASTGDEDRGIIWAARYSGMDFSMASLSG